MRKKRDKSNKIFQIVIGSEKQVNMKLSRGKICAANFIPPC